MALRYYPSFRTQNNQSTTGGDYTLNGQPYVGKFYLTYDGKAYSGADPLSGTNQVLTPANQYQNSPVLSTRSLPQVLETAIARATPNTRGISTVLPTQTQSPNLNGPTPYYPYPIQSDYDRGYIIRYFVKKVNTAGYIIEISQDQYVNIQNGTALYDISMYMTGQILWKLTGPLNAVRVSQYDTRAGIIDTNKRLTENLNKTMLGITDFIGGDYSKWARPTT